MFTQRVSRSHCLREADAYGLRAAAACMHGPCACVALRLSSRPGCLCFTSDFMSAAVLSVLRSSGCFACLPFSPQLLGCRGALAERDAGHIFATPARICQVKWGKDVLYSLRPLLHLLPVHC